MVYLGHIRRIVDTTAHGLTSNLSSTFFSEERSQKLAYSLKRVGIFGFD